ncbi:MAG TPA: hypothetical protein VNL97_02720 [Solirubrobacterales bacterium]|nr:hypothetical protein [Solirubrobacterales bacterium]
MRDPRLEYLTKFPQEQLDAAEEASIVDESVVRAAMARVPPSWSVIKMELGTGWFRRGSLQVAYSVQRYGGSDIWVHASVCGRSGAGGYYLPTFEELKRVKNDFIGEDRWAYQAFPSSKDYVNHNPYVLHLYALIDGKPALPDFTMGLGTI